MTLICTYLVIKEFEHLFIYLLNFWILSFCKMPPCLLLIFSVGLTVFFLFLSQLSLVLRKSKYVLEPTWKCSHTDTRKSYCDFVWECVESIGQFEENWYFYSIKSSGSCLWDILLSRFSSVSLSKVTVSLQSPCASFVRFISRYLIVLILL